MLNTRPAHSLSAVRAADFLHSGCRVLLGFLFGLSLLCAMLPQVAVAKVFQPASLYEISIPVVDQDASQQKARLNKALAGVLVRLTGDRDIGSDPLASPVLSRANEMVQAFGYTSRWVEEPDPLDPTAPPQQREQLYFKARFDATSVNESLLAARLPVWGKERPLTAAWVVIRDEGGDRVLSETTADTESAALLEAADLRGLPVALPSQATISGGQVGATALMDGNDDSVVNASLDMNAQSVAIGRLSQSGAGWQGAWTLLQPDQPPRSWDVIGVTVDEVQAAGLHHIADAYAASYARLSVGISGGVTYLSIKGMQSAADYARVSSYLESLSIVQAADVLALHAGKLTYRIELRGDASQLEQTINLGNVLERDWETSTDPRVINYVLRQ